MNNENSKANESNKVISLLKNSILKPQVTKILDWLI